VRKLEYFIARTEMVQPRRSGCQRCKRVRKWPSPSGNVLQLREPIRGPRATGDARLRPVPLVPEGIGLAGTRRKSREPEQSRVREANHTQPAIPTTYFLSCASRLGPCALCLGPCALRLATCMYPVLLSTYYVRCIAYRVPRTEWYLLRTTYYVPRSTYSVQLTMYHLLSTMSCIPCTVSYPQHDMHY